MNKTDWLEYFEAINGRTATDEEIQQAQDNGEFQDYAVTDALVAKDGVDAGQPLTSDPIKSEVIAAATLQQGQQPVSHGKSFFKDFWEWLVSAWKSPASVAPTNSYNGYVAYGLLAFFNALTIFIVANHAASAVSDFGNGILDALGGGNSSSYSNPVGIDAFFSIFIGVALYIFSVIFAGFLVRRFIYQENDFTFTQSFEYYGRLLSVNILLSALATLFALANVNTLVVWLVLIGLFLFTNASVFALAKSRNSHSTMDVFYRYLIAVVVNGIIMVIFALIEFQLLAEYIGHLFGSLL